MLKNPSARRATGLLGLAALLLAPGLASALSLGDPRVESLYGQPLRLRLPVDLVTEEEQSDVGLLRARLLGAEHYDAESAALPEIALNELDIGVEQAEGRRWVVISSRRSLREPMLTLFVNVRLGASQLTREIPVLLDFPTPRRAPPPAAPTVAAPSVPLPAAEVREAVPMPLAPTSPPANAAVPAPAPEAAAPLASPQRRRRSAASAALVWPERPAGYSRLRLEERLTSFQGLGTPPPPAAGATVAGGLPAETIAAPVSVADAPAPAIPAPVISEAQTDLAEAAAGDGRSWWGWLLAGLALLAAVGYGWRRRTSAASAGAPIPVVLSTTAAPSPTAAAALSMPEPPLADEPALAATVPVVLPFERSLDLADPPDFALDPDAPADAGAGPARDRYPNQALRERVTQLSRLVSTASERRKLELVKAYIDVERIDSAEKLLAELEERYPVYGRPDTVDFELV